mmetsp:Transcript_50719/g.135207  ORF Transcript_50719/g.135207 Transcript_50719/m.135207 type:complete len:221 (+) Transcript_50719:766-1428(+)
MRLLLWETLGAPKLTKQEWYRNVPAHEHATVGDTTNLSIGRPEHLVEILRRNDELGQILHMPKPVKSLPFQLGAASHLHCLGDLRFDSLPVFQDSAPFHVVSNPLQMGLLSSPPLHELLLLQCLLLLAFNLSDLCKSLQILCTVHSTQIAQLTFPTMPLGEKWCEPWAQLCTELLLFSRRRQKKLKPSFQSLWTHLRYALDRLQHFRTCMFRNGHLAWGW